jgi:hypothetical protein
MSVGFTHRSSLGCQCSPGMSESDCGYLAARKETWTMKATAGAGCNE